MSILIAFLFGTTVSPYISLTLEYFLLRPRRGTQRDVFDHCKGCTIPQ